MSTPTAFGETVLYQGAPCAVYYVNPNSTLDLITTTGNIERFVGPEDVERGGTWQFDFDGVGLQAGAARWRAIRGVLVGDIVLWNSKEYTVTFITSQRLLDLKSGGWLFRSTEYLSLIHI